jgi:hypothetical protein
MQLRHVKCGEGEIDIGVVGLLDPAVGVADINKQPCEVVAVATQSWGRFPPRASANDVACQATKLNTSTP